VTEEEIGHAVIAVPIKVHSAVGPGLVESAYETCLLYELEPERLAVRRQVSLHVADA
jgi:GxxExxY protein